MKTILCVSFFALFLLTSCTKCKDKNCENGYCLGDRCVCEVGFTGDNCEFALNTNNLVTGVTFYTTCNNCNGLSVSVDNGTSKELTFYFFNETALCQEEGTVHFDLSTGSHTYQTNDGQNGNFILNKDVCRVIKI